MVRKATKCIPVRPDTKELVDDLKPEGETFDRFVRRMLNEER